MMNIPRPMLSPRGGRQAQAGAGRQFSPEVTRTGSGPTGYTVTFRYDDPAATRVQIKGEWYFSDPQDTTISSSQGLLPGQWQPGDVPIASPNSTAANWPVIDMTRDPRTGVWSYTTPLPSGTFTYGFFVNCASDTGAGCTEISDPANPPWNDGQGVTTGSVEPDSEVFVPSDPAFGTVRYWWQAPGWSRGRLADVSYPSPQSVTPPGTHPLVVYTPPGYDPHRATPYPVLYLSHGAGGNEVDWSTQGVAGNILDNLIDTRRIQPMVVVMTNFNGLPGGPGFPVGYPADLTGNVIPYVQAHYDVSGSASGRALGGLSAGGGLANVLLFSDTAEFGYYSVMSNDLYPVTSSPALFAPLKSVLGLQIGGGVQDPLRGDTTGEEAELASNSVPFTDDSIAGGHEWYVWRILLHDFLVGLAFKATTTTVTQPRPDSVTATVTADSPEPATPAGTVQFYVDGVRLGRAHRLISGRATQALPPLPAGGPPTITAVYSGDNYYRGSTGSGGCPLG
jgi:enterochelin esterase-like enzyme